MKKKLYIHIGHGKTGTTSIQHALMRGANTGLYLWPASVGHPKGAAIPEASHRLAIGEPNRFASLEEQRQMHSNLLREIEESKAEKIFMSSEMSLPVLWTRELKEMVNAVAVEKINFFQELYSRYDTKIIYYVRNAFDIVPSMFDTHDRIYNIGSTQEDFENYALGKLDYNKRNQPKGPIDQLFFYKNIEGWKKHAGRERIITRLYHEDTLLNGNIVDDFFEAIQEEELLSKLNFDKSLRHNKAHREKMAINEKVRDFIIAKLKEDHENFARYWLKEDERDYFLKGFPASSR